MPQTHKTHLHEIVIRFLKDQKKGQVLDLPSGPGYLLKDLKKLGFGGVCGEIDESLHVFSDLDYKKIDMCARFPFPDASFDYVLSIEGIEHIENHFIFLREVSRVLKPGGKFVMTTPNIHSLESRLEYFLAGFHNMAAHPIPLNAPNMYFEHINPIDLNQLYFAAARADMEFLQLLKAKIRKGSRGLYYLFYPLIYFYTYRACILKGKASKEENRKIFNLLISKMNQVGGHTIAVFGKK
jgi:SAM-dependent methyltransferase